MSAFVPPLQRLQYVDGQVLTSRDLRDAEQINQRLQVLHNRCLHNTWGICFGLQVATAATQRAAAVKPGYAIDRNGNSIFVSGQATVETPRLPQPQVLALALSAPGTLEWWQPTDLTPGAQVLLGAAFITNGLISGSIDTGMRRYVQSFAAPRLATGITVAGQTVWVDSPGPAIWVEATVNTGTAGFVSAPQYFVCLQPAGVPLSLVKAGPQSFVTRVIGATAKQAQAEAWTISWIGIESEGLL